MSNPKYLIIISGPTASGKTGLSLELAQHYDTEILSADSRQFYRELTIGTAKPTPDELAKAPHHFINSLSIQMPYSVGDYEKQALTLLDQLFQKKDIVLLVGGSGLFIKAVSEGLDAFPKIPTSIRTELNQLYEEQGIQVLQQELQEVDPEYYQRVDLNNPKRLIRALEVFRHTQKPFSQYRKQQSKSRSFFPIYLQMNWPRETLYARINQRVDLMIKNGLVDEVAALQAYESLNALQTVGYQEFFPYLRGDYGLEDAVELLKRNSRRYAKRQMTWNRRLPYWKHFHPSETNLIKKYLKWSMEGHQSFFWKKENEAKHTISMGIRKPDQSTTIFNGIVKKNSCTLSYNSNHGSLVDTDTQQLLLHEIEQRNIDRSIRWELPPPWK